jgi:hypothetical protein
VLPCKLVQKRSLAFTTKRTSKTRFHNRLLLAFAFVAALWASPALAQETRGTSPLQIPDGGTGASTASGARTNLGLGTMATRSTAVIANLPSATAWSAANPSGQEIVITDYFTPPLFAGDTFAWGGVTPKVTANFGALKFRPDPSLPGWIVRSVN